MRNFVAKNDFNRAVVHPDKSKQPPDLIDEGMEEHLIEVHERSSGNTPEQIAWAEYKARCDQVLLGRANGEPSIAFSGPASDEQVLAVLFDLQRMESALQEEHYTIPPGLTREEKRQFIIDKAE